MKALLFERAPARFAAARITAAVRGSGTGATHGPLRLAEVHPPELPGDEWIRVRPTLAGICGSDLATVDGASSRYFEELVSFPFVPGHEVVGTVTEPPAGARSANEAGGSGARSANGAAVTAGSTLAAGDRVVIEPVIGCVPRGIDPPCSACATGHTGSCQHVAFGHLAPGLQIGYCCDTGGGWSTAGLVAHVTQIHLVPPALSDEDAVMVEPTACAVHGALAGAIEPQHQVAVVGAGTLGLAVVAAVRQLSPPSRLLVGAKYPHQQAWAAELGADQVVAADQLDRAVRRSTRSLRSARHDTAGADVVVDCVGTAQSLARSLALVRPRGRVVLLGMPGRVSLDLAGLWHREIALVGAYAYGVEAVRGAVARRTFDLAFEVVAAARLGRLVSARYPLDRYSEALAHAGSAGRRGAVKVVFDLCARSPLPAPGSRPTPPPRTAVRPGHSPASQRKGPSR
ncbi:MAG: zinc-binding dehydrogenase [Actinomycetota bacterium]|nr:zinc-binding dehydrogenase [Actinomycetota bacterium]